jgi:two-component system, OmpR family, response regulator
VASIHIEIVESNPHLRSLLGWHLQQAGYNIHLAANYKQAQELFVGKHPELVVVDSDLPDGSGIDLCRWLQGQHQGMVFMLSARNSEVDIVTGLKAGADDYLTKPFGMQEFLARIESLCRRSHPAPPAFLRYGNLRVDLVQRRVHWGEELIDLTPQEFSLLYVLAQAGGRALSRQDLLQRAWPEAIDNPRTVDTHILSLRKKIEPAPHQPRLIQTVRNLGYRLNLENLQSTSNYPSSTPPPLVSNMAGRQILPAKAKAASQLLG